MQSGNGMTMQEAEQEIKYYQKIFQVARLLKGEDVERTFYQQGKGTCENVQDGCPCYSLWKKNGKCENCSSYKALREKKQMIKLEFLESEVYQVISRYMEIDGQPYVMELINHLEDDTLIDISCREKLINKLTGYNEKLYKDVLTGVYNRLYFEEEIKMWTGNAGIIVIDVDDFKLCNDTYGHLTGDMALAVVAGVIWRCIRREDTLVRYGGDEFVLVLPEIKEDGLVEKLQEIQEKIQNAVIPGYSNIQLSVSMGAVISQNESVEHAMLRADKLMYQAKNEKNMAITENNMIDHEGKIHAQQQPEKMIPEILVVDDEEVNRTLLDMIFSKDYHVLQAESGEKCIEILEQQVNSISLVLLDVVLPEMDGFDVLTYMNKNHWIEDIPVIMMSGADAPEAVKRAYALGAVDFVSKPCDAQIVYQRVTNTMKLYAKQRRLTSLITAQINEKEKNSEMLIHILSHIVEFRNGESGSHVIHIHKLTEMLLERLAQKTEKYHLDGRVALTTGDLALGRGELTQRFTVGSDVGHDYQNVHILLKGQIFGSGQGTLGGEDTLDDGVIGQVEEHDNPVHNAGFLKAAAEVVADLEDPDIIKARIQEAAQYIPLDRLCLSTQCGFASTQEASHIHRADADICE